MCMVGLGLVNFAVAVPITNDVTVTTNKVHYAAFQHITCSISGMKNDPYLVRLFNNTDNENTLITADKYGKKREAIRIVSSKDLTNNNTTNLNKFPDQAYFSSSKFSNISTDYDMVNVTVQMYYDNIIGPVFGDFYSYDDDSMLQSYDNGNTIVTIVNKTWIACPYQCVVVNKTTQQILGASKPFTIGPPNPVTINVNANSYIPGQTLIINMTSQNKSTFEDRNYGDYLRVYKVPYDVKMNPVVLNTNGGNATYIKTIDIEYSKKLSPIEQLIDWKIPEKYQLVLLSKYKQLVRGISNVFEVKSIKQNKQTTLTFNNGTIDTNNVTRIYPGQSIQITINTPGPPIGSKIVTAFIKAKDTVTTYSNGTKEWIAMSDGQRTWDSTSTSLTITTARFNRLDSGYYKVVVLAGGIVIGVSKQINIQQPLIQIRLPKTNYYQWEPIPFQNYITNPYFTPDVYYKENYVYIYEIVPLNFVSPNGTMSSDFSPVQYGLPIYNNNENKQNTNINTLQPGLYNIRLFIHRYEWYNDHYYQLFWLEKVITIKDTIFRVVSNDGILTIKNYKPQYKYNDYINYTFTTQYNVQLGGQVELNAALIKTNTSSDITTIDLNNNKLLANNKTTYNGSIQIRDPYFGCTKTNKTQIPLKL
jgi:hypothetical protein